MRLLAAEETVDSAAEFDDLLLDLLHLVSQFFVRLLEILGVEIKAELADAGPSLEESVVCGSKILGIRARIANVPSKELLIDDLIGFSFSDKGIDITLVGAFGNVVIDVLHWEFFQGLVELLDVLCRCDASCFCVEISKSGGELGIVKKTDVSAGKTVSLKVGVADAGLRSVDIIAARSVGIARIGLVTYICVAGLFALDISAEVKAGVTGTRE